MFFLSCIFITDSSLGVIIQASDLHLFPKWVVVKADEMVSSWWPKSYHR